MGGNDRSDTNEGNYMSDKELLKEYTVELISKLIRYKEEHHIEPLMALMPEMSTELMSNFRGVLNELVEEKVLDWHRNINGILMFEFKRK